MPESTQQHACATAASARAVLRPDCLRLLVDASSVDVSVAASLLQDPPLNCRTSRSRARAASAERLPVALRVA